MYAASQVVAFLLCFLVVTGTSCPVKEDLYPCECEEVNSGKVIVTCSGERIHQQDIKRALSRMGRTQIVKLKLEALENVGKLKGDLFDGHNILELDIAYCDIEELTEGEKLAFSGLEDSLEVLKISNSLKSSASLKLSHLRNLRMLGLFGNKVQQLEEECFPDSLTSLLIYNTEIKSVADRAFANLDNLLDVELSLRKLNTFKRGWLPVPSTKLRSLALENNNLKNLPRDAFSHMPSLLRVYLQNNSIRSMDEETWTGVLPQLDRIDMRGNPLVCDSKLRWMQQVEGRAEIHGKCLEPANVAEMEIEDWLRQASPEFDQIQE